MTGSVHIHTVKLSHLSSRVYVKIIHAMSVCVMKECACLSFLFSVCSTTTVMFNLPVSLSPCQSVSLLTSRPVGVIDSPDSNDAIS